VKAQPALARIPIILATALTQPEQIEEFHRAGIAAILKKPFGPAELREMVERHLPAA